MRGAERGQQGEKNNPHPAADHAPRNQSQKKHTFRTQKNKGTSDHPPPPLRRTQHAWMVEGKQTSPSPKGRTGGGGGEKKKHLPPILGPNPGMKASRPLLNASPSAAPATPAAATAGAPPGWWWPLGCPSRSASCNSEKSFPTFQRFSQASGTRTARKNAQGPLRSRA